MDEEAVEAPPPQVVMAPRALTTRGFRRFGSYEGAASLFTVDYDFVLV